MAGMMSTETVEGSGSGSNSGMDTASPVGSTTQSITANASRDSGAASGALQTASHPSFRRYYFLGMLGGGVVELGEICFATESFFLL